MGGARRHQFQWRNILLGLEGAYIDTFTDQWASNSSTVSTRLRQSRIDSIWLVTPRVGYGFDQFFVYAKAGYANGDAQFRVVRKDNGLIASAASNRVDGWVAGAGVDYGLMPNLTLGLEYDYINFDIGNTTMPAVIPRVPTTYAKQVNAYDNLLMARVNYKFG